MSSLPPVRVAIIGSGLTGLVAAYLLSSCNTGQEGRRICVEIFERAPTPGMDSASISVPLHATSETMRIDVPMRAFTGGYYPQLLALYTHLGIKVHKTNFTYSFATAIATSAAVPEPTILYNGSNGLRGISLPSQLRSSAFKVTSLSTVAQHLVNVKCFLSDLLVLVLGYIQLLIIALWHYQLGNTTSQRHPLVSFTLRDLVEQPFPRSNTGVFTSSIEAVLRRTVGLDRRFVCATLVPLFSAVMTSSSEAVWDSPASQIIDYVALTLGKDHFVVKDGVRKVVAALLIHFNNEDTLVPQSKVWTEAEVHSVQYLDGKAWLDVVHHDTTSQPASTTRHGGYDHLIFATQANQSATFLRQYRDSLTKAGVASEQMDAIISSVDAFKYEKSLVINHTDASLLPSAKSDWRDLNLVSPQTSLTKRKHDYDDSTSWQSKSSTSSMATHILSQNAPTHQYPLLLQTTNPLPHLMPSKASILSSTYFERAVISVPSHKARQHLFTHTSNGTLQLGELHKRKDTSLPAVWTCGSWSTGIPLLEGCVVSARLVAQEIARLESFTLAHTF